MTTPNTQFANEIESLTDAINANPGSETVTTEQVAAFVGADATLADIENMISDTKFNDPQGVTVEKVLAVH